MKLSDYGITKRLDASYKDAVEKTRAALKEEGFGVLTEIDVKATMKEKLDLDFQNYVILGACNPPMAHRALSADLAMGLFLPCNVIVYEEDGQSVVSAMDPVAMVSGVDNDAAKQVAAEIRPRLERAIKNLV